MNKSLIFIAIVFIAASCGKPIADFTYSGDENAAPAKVQFDNKSEKSESYEWDFGDGESSSEASPNHEYNSSGNYLVKLKATKGKKTTITEKRVMINAPEVCLVELETVHGTMTIKLFDSTPQHRDNFLKLVEQGFYDDLLFHRVINGFMIQGGDPQSRGAAPDKRLGAGGPGYTIPAEFVDSLMHVKGALAAARQGDQVNPEKRSSGSQFYIVHGRPVSEKDMSMIEARKGFRYSKAQRETYMEHGGTPFLDRDYTVFGIVVKGMEVVDKIAGVATKPGDRPKEDVKMKIRAVK